MKISPTLRMALRNEGFAKLAAGVRAERGEHWAPPGAFGANLGASLNAAVETLALKMAASDVNDRAVRAGLDSYAHLETLR